MDKRGKKIIYVSHCLLNQNLRFPGIAVQSGAIVELITILIRNGIGIELLPCLERKGWGGVSRKTFYKFFPFINKTIGTKKFPITKLILRFWLSRFKKKCRKEAKKIVNQMIDYVKSGYTILGIITTNDSPTCGYTKTINLLEALKKYKAFGMTPKALRKPNLEEMKNFIPNLCKEGSGFFTSELVKQMKKRKLKLSILGFNIWNNLTEETKRVIQHFDLTI
ncbi:MAG: hypothetical protein ACFE8L_05590 [Candidatus Hodarchaeota archaeon]